MGSSALRVCTMTGQLSRRRFCQAPRSAAKIAETKRIDTLRFSALRAAPLKETIAKF